MLESGSQVGRYVIRRKLTEGGMAEIYTARAVGPEGFSKDVVIKIIHSFLARDSQFVQMFIAEARLASKLNHANVVQIFDFGKHDASYYLAMEYVRGASLWDLRKRCREHAMPFPPALAAEIGAQVARGLQYAHALTEGGQKLGVVHRDVTPHNVLLSFDGAVKLTDFGIAKAASTHTVPGMLKGKFAYMSPEQSRGDVVDARTDVFALGIVLWELLTGGRLFAGDSDLAVLRAVQESFIAPPSRLNPEVPSDLSDVVMKALARVPEERFQSAFEFEKALANWVLRTAKTVEDTSVALFLQQVFRDECETPSLEHPLPDVDEVGTADTQARPVRSGQKTITATPHPIPAPELESRNAKTLTTFRTAGPAEDDSSKKRAEELAPRSGGSPSTKVKTEQMPPLRRSVRKLEPLPVPTAAEAPSVIVSESSSRLPTERVAAIELPSVIAALAEPEPEPVAPRPRSNLPLLGGLGLLLGVGALGGYAWSTLEGVAMAPTPVVAAAQAPVEPEPEAAPPAKPEPEPAPPPAPVEAPPSPMPAPEEALVPSPKPAPVEALVPSPRPADPRAPAPVKPAEPEPAPKPAPATRKMGSLAVKAMPFATVHIQGKTYEVVGVQKLPAPAGTYEIVLVHPRRTTRARVTVEPGETTSVTFSAD